MEKNAITAQLVQEHVLANPFLADYLERDLINTAALARELLPAIVKENPKATVESISVALRRIPPSGTRIFAQLRHVVSNVQIATRTDVVLFCLDKSAKVPDMKEFRGDDIFFVNHGPNEITVIVDEKNAGKVRGRHLLSRKGLALVSVKDTLVGKDVNYRVTPGFVSVFLTGISREGINIEDVITTYSQVTFVVDERDLVRVFAICRKAKAGFR